MRVTFDASALDRLAARIGAAQGRVVARTQAHVVVCAAKAVRVAQAHVAVDTGLLRESIGFDVHPDGMGATVGPPAFLPRVYTSRGDVRLASYPRWVEYGTGPHMIYPRTDPRSPNAWEDEYPGGPSFATMLWGPGMDHPVGEVDHPGTRARPYMRPAGAAVMPEWIAGLIAIGRSSL